MNLSSLSRRGLWLLLLPALLLTIHYSFIALPVTSADETAPPPLLAFYYGWYDDQTWTSGLSPQMPLIPYRSADPATIARHVGWGQIRRH